MTKAERARELFLEGCNSAQAVFLAFAEEKMDRDTALKNSRRATAHSSAVSCWASTRISNPSRLSRAPTAITKNVRVRKWSTARQTFSRSIYPKKAENRHIGTREGLLRLLQTGKR